VAEGDTTFGEIVGRQFHGDFIAGQNADAIAAEAPGEVGQDNAVMFQLDTEQSTGKFLEDGSGNFDAIFFTQRFSLLPFSPIRQLAA
jgi:hypothetical protein